MSESENYNIKRKSDIWRCCLVNEVKVNFLICFIKKLKIILEVMWVMLC